MKLVKTDEAKPGQKVARDVTDLRGNLLFKSGTALTPELVAACRQRNISHLFLEDEADSSVGAADLESRREALMRDVDRQFAGTGDGEAMLALKEAAKRHLNARALKP